MRRFPIGKRSASAHAQNQVLASSKAPERRLVPWLWAGYLALVALHWSSLARAQDELPGIAPMGAAPQPGGQQAPPPSDMPETHAASDGMESTLPQGNEPSLPEDPLAVSPATQEAIGSDGDADALGTPDDAKRQFYGLYYNEKAGEYRYRVAFPVWAQRTKPSVADPTKTDRASLFGGLYYNRRAPEHRDDIFFPVFWNVQNPLEKSRTTVLGPFVNRRTKTASDDWLLPIYATGKRPDGGYTVIPPLLTYRNRDSKGGLNVIGPGFCKWKGGQSCDTRTAQDIELGIAPFYFFGQNEKRLYEVIPPLGHYYRYDNQLLSWTNIYGPYYRRHTEKREMLHFIPIYFSVWGPQERHTTVLPLFHYGYKEKDHLLVTPLFLNRKHEGRNTFVTWGYARHRGETHLDMVTPLYWYYRDPRIGLKRHVFLPFLYTNHSPRESTVAVFPFFSLKKRHGISQSLWITPLFNNRRHLQGYSTSVLPAFFFGKNGHKSHAVVAPLYFDFNSPKSRTTIIPPLLFGRHRGEDTVSQLVGNVYYHERKYQNGKEWEVHILPLLHFGKSPNGHFWSVLYGMAGYKRQGPVTSARVLWLPIPLSNE